MRSMKPSEVGLASSSYDLGACGSAALQCGKAMPYRSSYCLILRLRFSVIRRRSLRQRKSSNGKA
jgi:hypothetical protein